MSLRGHIFRNERTEPTVYGYVADEDRAKRYDDMVVPVARTGTEQKLVKENYLNWLSVHSRSKLNSGVTLRLGIPTA
ncbi:hypothetical protein Y032_0351g3243 [Ancylostoma ceylanicum]|uniref:Uncharacterized protein n=1 Tax=Ancylostoma ceylanicum TaxID=53326 RepID=A0A016RWR5_9BILA|nr:hypothetical protein Y032_0351g3243 [Ancylostoma ceylanicum]